jgi:D-alanyl-D-alanine carboxypeptidase (penicillin-binding protein 5/6)
MNRKIKVWVILCIPLITIAFFSIRYLISFATISDDQRVAPSEDFQNEAVLSYSEVSFDMYSQHALLINLTTGEVMFEHDASARVYPASLTKIMTVLVGLEQAESDTMIVRADFERLMLDNASIAGFEYGEERTLMEVLHGAMLPSGADATATIAHNIAGSYEAFVELMNERARTLGMHDTNFMNTSGLHDENHYTTAHDMAILLRYALDNPRFREIFTARSYSFTTFYGEQRTMDSTLFANMWTTEFTGGEIIGGRTGFTTEAGRCLASLATNGRSEFILITLGADPYAAGQTAHIFDAFTIYEYFHSKE